MTDERPTTSSSLDQVVAELKGRVEQRRLAGEYPPNLEHDLNEHFRRIVAHRATPDLSHVRARLQVLDERSRFGADRIATSSAVRGGEALQRAVAKAVSRQTSGVLDQVQGHADAVRDVLSALTEALEDPEGLYTKLVGQLDAVLDRLVAFDRRALAAETAIAELSRRVEQLEATSARLP